MPEKYSHILAEGAIDPTKLKAPTGWIGPVYHGSRFKTLRKLSVQSSGSGVIGSQGQVKVLWFTSSIDNAVFYTDVKSEHESELEYIYVCFLKMKNPLVFEPGEHLNVGTAGYVQKAKDGGYDGLIRKDVVDGTDVSDVYAVWNDNQIKVVGTLEQNDTIGQAHDRYLDQDMITVYGNDDDGYYAFYNDEDEDNDSALELGGPYDTEDEAERAAIEVINRHNKSIGPLKEMAVAPRSKAKAERLARVLPADMIEAKHLIKAFWDAFLGNDRMASNGAKITDEHIAVKKTKDGFAWLTWHAIVTLPVRPSVYLTIVFTSTDDPGTYRIDFVLLGQKRAFIRELRSQVSSEAMRMQDRLSMTLSDDDLAEFERIQVSTAKAPPSALGTPRNDHNLVARLLLDKIPLYKLATRADDIASTAQMILDKANDKLNESSAFGCLSISAAH